MNQKSKTKKQLKKIKNFVPVSQVALSKQCAREELMLVAGGKDIPLEEVPYLPERQREFAFRWATECLRSADLARMFNVNIGTILRWKSKPNIVKYYLLVTRARNVMLAERANQLAVNRLKKYQEILDTPIDGYTAEPIRRTLLDIGAELRGGMNSSSDSVNVNVQTNVQTNVKNENTNENNISIGEFRERLNELEALEQAAEVVEEDNVEDE